MKSRIGGLAANKRMNSLANFGTFRQTSRLLEKANHKTKVIKTKAGGEFTKHTSLVGRGSMMFPLRPLGSLPLKQGSIPPAAARLPTSSMTSPGMQASLKASPELAAGSKERGKKRLVSKPKIFRAWDSSASDEEPTAADAIK